MRIASTLRLWISVVGLLAFWMDRSAATSCMVPSPADAMASHALVFLGTVEAVQDTALRPRAGLGRGRFAWMRMSASWKGVPRRELLRVAEIVDPGGGPMLARGGTYVVYADTSAIGWRVEICSRTRRLADASEDLAALGKPTPVQRIPGRKLRPTR